jgi:hypothetical protein
LWAHLPNAASPAATVCLAARAERQQIQNCSSYPRLRTLLTRVPDSEANRALSGRPGRRRAPWIAARWWMAALSSCTWFAAPGESAADTRPPSVEVRRGDAVLVGSSSFNQSFGHLIARELAQRGFQVTRKGVSGAGLARPDLHDMHEVLETLPIGNNTAAVFVYLGVNDAQSVWLYPHERDASGAASVPFGGSDWEAVYGRRTHDFLERICQRGAQRAIVLLPVDVNRPDMQRRLDRVRELQVRAASQTSCAVVVSTAGDVGQFEVAGQAKRMADGYHMSALGAQIVWERIEPQVERLLDQGVPR